MDARLLKLGTRDRNGVRRWLVPGFMNGARILPSALSQFGTLEARWPAIHPNDGDEIIRGARLDWHRTAVKNEIRKLLKNVKG